MSPPDVRHIRTSCTRDCLGGCGLIALVREGAVIRLTGDPDHPLTRGAACGKTRAFLARHQHPDRVLHPLRRDRQGQWRRVSWDAALDELAGRISGTIARHGREAVLYYQGYGERTATKLLNERLFNLLGGVTTLSGSLCSGTGVAAQEMDCGSPRVSHDPEDLAHSRHIVLWGRNPAATQHNLAPFLKDCRARGGEVLLVDPAPTESAALATHLLQPRPGRDAALALAVCKLVLERGDQDQAFLTAHTENHEAFLALLEGLDTEALLAACDLVREEAELVARTMADGPTAVLLGWGLHRYVHAHQAVRAIDALACLTGNLGVAGGGVSQGFDEYGPFDQSLRGRHLCPPRRKLCMPLIGRELLDADPPVRLALITAGNPLNMAPNSALVRRGFEAVDFVALAGHFLDDTSEVADLFLPATTFLETEDMVAGFGHNFAGPVRQAAPPRGECRSDFELFQALGERLGLTDYVRPLEDWLASLCKPLLDLGHTLEDLRRGPVRDASPMVPYAGGRFHTPSGRFRFLETFDPAPPRPPGLSGNPERYPFTLLSTVAKDWLCSELAPDAHPEPTVRLAPEAMAGLGLAEGQAVELESPVGRARAVARALEGLRSDVALVRRGGWIKAGHGFNRLTLDCVSAVGEGTPYFETRVRVSPFPIDP